MTTEIMRLSVPRRYRAWCDDCQDGYQGGKKACENWAAKHDAERHGGQT